MRVARSQGRAFAIAFSMTLEANLCTERLETRPCSELMIRDLSSREPCSKTCYNRERDEHCQRCHKCQIRYGKDLSQISIHQNEIYNILRQLYTGEVNCQRPQTRAIFCTKKEDYTQVPPIRTHKVFENYLQKQQQ